MFLLHIMHSFFVGLNMRLYQGTLSRRTEQLEIQAALSCHSFLLQTGGSVLAGTELLLRLYGDSQEDVQLWRNGWPAAALPD
eukprot:COSAG06_NODE_209_length_20178_cov_4.309478_17_plen_82_part_00